MLVHIVHIKQWPKKWCYGIELIGFVRGPLSTGISNYQVSFLVPPDLLQSLRFTVTYGHSFLENSWLCVIINSVHDQTNFRNNGLLITSHWSKDHFSTCSVFTLHLHLGLRRITKEPCYCEMNSVVQVIETWWVSLYTITDVNSTMNQSLSWPSNTRTTKKLCCWDMYSVVQVIETCWISLSLGSMSELAFVSIRIEGRLRNHVKCILWSTWLTLGEVHHCTIVAC